MGRMGIKVLVVSARFRRSVVVVARQRLTGTLSAEDLHMRNRRRIVVVPVPRRLFGMDLGRHDTLSAVGERLAFKRRIGSVMYKGEINFRRELLFVLALHSYRIDSWIPGASVSRAGLLASKCLAVWIPKVALPVVFQM
ncbi:hypothetical protein RSAG8_09002, partial [Rhizoctonia solani AG-8 WAC10335]